MVFVTGDCHADFKRFSRKKFPDQAKMNENDIVIVCGDFGIWHNDAEERESLDLLNNKPFTTAFVDGNHENFDRLYSDEFPMVDFHGGKAHQIRPHIYHLMRGEMYTFDGKKFWCFGGASSHDIDDGVLDVNDFKTKEDFIETIREYRMKRKSFRINRLSWWKEELPTQEEMDYGMKVLEENNFETDYIITHCCPQEVALMLGFHESDVITRYFNDIARLTKFNKWFFGHYHGEECIFGKFILHYYKVERVL